MNLLTYFSKKIVKKLTKWNEFGTFRSIFTSFGSNIYASDIVRSCIRPLAEHTSKANPKCNDKMLERLIELNPNDYMNGKAFLYKVRTQYEIKNNAFIAIMREPPMKVIGLYPIPYSTFEALQDERGNLYIKFFLSNGSFFIQPWQDLVVLRKDYNESDIAGDDNRALLDQLELISTANQGLANAVKSTANLRGIIKVTKGMLDPEDIKKKQKQFTDNYMTVANEGGLAAIDNTMEFEPVNITPSTASWAQMKEFRENIYRYFGVSESIVTSNYKETEFDAFYESKIEPFLLDLGLELTRKIYSERQLGHGNAIRFESNRLAYASNKTKLAMVAMVDRGALTPNEWREIFNLAPVEGGDIPIRRLDTAAVDETKPEEEEDE